MRVTNRCGNTRRFPRAAAEPPTDRTS